MLKITVMGPGGVGGYFGARLAAAGNEVTFVARGAHLDAMRARGLRLDSEIGPLHLQTVKVAADAREVPAADAVIFSVKMRDTEAAAESLRGLAGKGATVFTFQNGVESADRIGCHPRVGQGGAGHGAHRCVDLGARCDQADRQIRAARFRRARRPAERAHDGLARGLQGRRHRRASVGEHPARGVDEVRNACADGRNDGADARADRSGPRQCAVAGAAAVGGGRSGGARRVAEDRARCRGRRNAS